MPLAITVLVVQNGQGFAVLRAAGHTPPINATTMACGIGSLIAAAVGGVGTCLTGPTNAIVVSSGEQKRQYSAAMFVGFLALLFGLLAPTFTQLLLASPKSAVIALAGLAMLRVLQTAFITAFKERFSLGALVAFLVTVADVPLLNVGAAFWVSWPASASPGCWRGRILRRWSIPARLHEAHPINLPVICPTCQMRPRASHMAATVRRTRRWYPDQGEQQTGFRYLVRVRGSRLPIQNDRNSWTKLVEEVKVADIPRQYAGTDTPRLKVDQRIVEIFPLMTRPLRRAAETKELARKYSGFAPYPGSGACKRCRGMSSITPRMVCRTPLVEG